MARVSEETIPHVEQCHTDDEAQRDADRLVPDGSSLAKPQKGQMMGISTTQITRKIVTSGPPTLA